MQQKTIGLQEFEDILVTELFDKVREYATKGLDGFDFNSNSYYIIHRAVKSLETTQILQLLSEEPQTYKTVLFYSYDTLEECAYETLVEWASDKLGSHYSWLKSDPENLTQVMQSEGS